MKVFCREINLFAHAKCKTPAQNTITLINVVFLMLIFFLIAGSLTPPLDKDVLLISTLASDSGAGNRKGGSDGNAAISNYPGRVAAKLRRAVRGVPRSARRGAKRDVHVLFVVMSAGGLGSVRLIQSSGSPELDQAALASVRRAAPFPPIPSAAGRSKWSFTVPLGLAR